MEDYFNHIFTVASELGYCFVQLLEDAYGYFYNSFPYHYVLIFGECPSSVEAAPAPIDSSVQDWTLSWIQKVRSFIKKSLLAPSYGLKLGCKIVNHCFIFCLLYLIEAQEMLQMLINRLRRTLEGSSADIGWLQKTKGLPPVVDGTARFKELLSDVRNGMHNLPNSLVYLFIPGLFSNHSPLYFVNTKRFFSKMGLTCHIAKIHSEASVEKNAWELKQYIEELYWGSGKRILLLGHSKGGIDAAAALSLYWYELRDKVAGLALVQSPYGGSPIASDILREGQIADKEARRIMEFIVCKLIKGDIRALEDLTYDKRKDFISKHKLPSDELPIVSFHTEASSAPGVLATMSHIAHAELPWLPLPQFLAQYEESYSLLTTPRVPVVIPLSAAMAISALHLRLRYGERSDGLVARCDAEVPGSVVVRLERKLDHAWMVYSTLRKDPVEADASEMCEALLTMLVENTKEKCDFP
ncbi:alpha/beta-Hydrolases superfamily protein [Rhynchospora pubera]|uniref:Alpha/beta-Hydrolases superfamily protein n=1 Tax=Rhynchospora pubera TaxID=906938 RepID=A0AAV8DR26_9POAL|nr:alpha/beta-Hydrolases superfamily protein [Rhynchospora pubera]KAJ4821612.1 alpha/beta-Hydrolases superfamily protein [Rhynchospora pubera]